ncbi:MAG TPA: hypothetical protein VEB22_02155 [Phycisphaerales bacterium]|nr:hypothetical protein [Phycisphaerales bacterium]
MSRLPRQQIEHTPAPAGPLNADQLRMERRRSPRRQIEEIVTAVFRDGRERFGLTRVLVIDSSHTGLGVRADQAFEPGTRFTLTANNMPMPHKSGTVVRCIPCEDGGYSVGIIFDRLKAA